MPPAHNHLPDGDRYPPPSSHQDLLAGCTSCAPTARCHSMKSSEQSNGLQGIQLPYEATACPLATCTMQGNGQHVSVMRPVCCHRGVFLTQCGAPHPQPVSPRNQHTPTVQQHTAQPAPACVGLLSRVPSVNKQHQPRQSAPYSSLACGCEGLPHANTMTALAPQEHAGLPPAKRLYCRTQAADCQP